MKIVNEMPTSGQFVVTWKVSSNELATEDFKWVDGVLCVYEPVSEDDEWDYMPVEDFTLYTFHKSDEVWYIVA